MNDKQKWNSILKEAEELCNVHGDGIDDFKKCREFNNRLALFLLKLEDMDCYQVADRVMDILGSCNPKVGSHCENSKCVKGMLERMRDRAKEEFNKCE
ncbi:MAG: hypothetical protein ACXQT4_04015 [Methanotrichaceae archaeon]